MNTQIVTFEDYFRHIAHDYKARKRGKHNIICPFCLTEGGKLYPATGANQYPKFRCFNDNCQECGVNMTVIGMHARRFEMTERDAFLDIAKIFKIDLEKYSAPIVEQNGSEQDIPERSIKEKALQKLFRQMKTLELANFYIHLPGNNKYRAPGAFFGRTLKEELVSRCKRSGVSKTTLERVVALKFNEVTPEYWNKTCGIVEDMLGGRLKEFDMLLRAGRVATSYEKFTDERLIRYAEFMKGAGELED